MSQILCNGDATVITIPQVFADLTGSVAGSQLPGGAPTGTGTVVMSTNASLTSPTLITPVLGTPASGTLTNCTFPTLNQNTTGTAGGLTGTPAITVGAITCTTVSQSGLQTKYNNLTTAGQGHPVILFQTSSATLTANFNAGAAQTMFTPTVSGSVFRISGTQQIVRAATTSSTFPSLTLGYTDSGGIARTVALVATSATNTTAVLTAFATTIVTNGTTAITITSAGYVSSGATSLEYALACVLEQLV